MLYAVSHQCHMQYWQFIACINCRIRCMGYKFLPVTVCQPFNQKTALGDIAGRGGRRQPNPSVCYQGMWTKQDGHLEPEWTLRNSNPGSECAVRISYPSARGIAHCRPSAMPWVPWALQNVQTTVNNGQHMRYRSRCAELTFQS